MINAQDLIAMPLDKAISLLSDYDIELVRTNANIALNKKLDENEFTHARVIRAVLEGKRAVLVYDNFKELSC